ncbi:MAG: ThuA domain-containing protein [Gemmataceae bacterium]
MKRCLALSLFLTLLSAPLQAGEKKSDPLWVVYEGGAGPGKGKHIVLVSGDEEYRSEEALPQLGKILAKQGFRCTVLFAIDTKTGTIDPNVNNNIPGLEALKNADLMIIATRFRNLPDEQMKPIADYIESGKPIMGMRTATHAFALGKGSAFAKYTWNNKEGGFGRHVLGETWVAHHGGHGRESTRGILAKDAKSPITRGIKDGDIWGPTDVYTAHPPKDANVIVFGQVLKGMKTTDEPVEGKKNDPMMPIAWTRVLPKDGKQQRIFTTTMGAATDLEAAGTRRMLVNAAYWALGMESAIPAEGANVDIIGTFAPRPFGNNGFRKGVRPGDLR